MTSARVNVLQDPEFDHKAIDSEFVFGSFTCRDYSLRASLCDDIRAMQGICSLKNSQSSEEGFTAYLMAYGGTDLSPVKELIDEKGEGEATYDLSLRSSDIEGTVLLQLMINAIGYDEMDGSPSNAAGRFYVIMKAKPVRGHIPQIIALEFHVSERDYSGSGCKDRILDVNVRTFTNTRERNRIQFGRKPFEAYARYVYDPIRGIRRKSDKDKGDEFILRSRRGVKNKVPFYTFGDLDKSARTKTHEIAELIKTFNLLYDGENHHLAHLDLDSMEITESVRPNSKIKKETVAKAESVLAGKPVYIVNIAGEDGKELVGFLKDRFAECGIDAKCTDTAPFDSFVIDVIHDKSYYEDNGKEDPYSSSEYSAHQHVTVEKFEDGLGVPVFESLLINLVIKDDILNGSISLYDWGLLGYAGSYRFGAMVGEYKGGDTEIAYVDVSPDGSISFCRETVDEAKDRMFSRAILSIDDTIDDKVSSGRVAVEDPDGNVNVIEDTSMFAVPDSLKTEHVVIDNISAGRGKTVGLRGSEQREEYHAEVIDVNYSKVSDSVGLYYCGIVGEGMRSSFDRASLVRRVVAVDGSELFFDRLLNLMAVTFVRNGDLTVRPFPFKYLREWCRMMSTSR